MKKAFPRTDATAHLDASDLAAVSGGTNAGDATSDAIREGGRTVEPYVVASAIREGGRTVGAGVITKP
jgi:hypothetical protein